MALARCKKCGLSEGRTAVYVKMVEALGYPDTALVCGKAGCINPALICLNEEEWKEYQSGVRIFSPPTAACKFRAK